MSTHPPSLNFETAVDLFNRSAFFECHEVLEDLWRPLPAGPEKEFLQGLLQVGVGFHHLLQSNYTGAKNLLQAGLDRLEAVAAQNEYQPPIALEPLMQTSREALSTVLALGPARLGEFPTQLIPQVTQP